MNSECLIYKQNFIQFLEGKKVFEEFEISKEIFETEIDYWIEKNYKDTGSPMFNEKDLFSFFELCQMKTISRNTDKDLRNLTSRGLAKVSVNEKGELIYTATDKGNQIRKKYTGEI
jgi:hypothetical protein